MLPVCFYVLLDSVQSLVPKIKLSEEPRVVVGFGCVIKTHHLHPECLSPCSFSMVVSLALSFSSLGQPRKEMYLHFTHRHTHTHTHLIETNIS